ncbi:MAG: glycosyltransferase family 1 protein [Pseudonocardiales bacterium]|nr:glycosyltransferase family 1 protein [Pseudonocardiales bacterium]
MGGLLGRRVVELSILGGSMRILIATAGSRGDVVPYTGLGAQLRQAGHLVSVATHTRFAALVEVAGLEFRALPVDPMAELVSDRGQRLVRARSAAREVAELIRLGRQLMPALGQGVLSAVRRGCDVLLLSATLAPLGQVVAEAFGLPSIGVFLQPMTPTREFQAPVPITRPLGPWGDYLVGRVTEAVMDQLLYPAVRQLRRRLGLPALTIAAQRRRAQRRGWPVLHGFSPAVVARPADWRPGMEVCGYWWPYQDPHWQPPAELVDFVQAGPPPVFVGFGSRVVPDVERLGAIVGAALRQTGLRAVVQTGWSGLSIPSDDVFPVDEVPHHWLFPRMAAVVHHYGAGTTAAGLRAGIPAVPVPAQFDTPFWAARLTALGVADAPIPLRKLSVGRLAAALKKAIEEPALRSRAHTLAARLAAEDGAAQVLHTLQRVDTSP